jgi:hypothetical protein
LASTGKVPIDARASAFTGPKTVFTILLEDHDTTRSSKR